MLQIHRSWTCLLIGGILLMNRHAADGVSLRDRKATFDVVSQYGRLRDGLRVPPLTALTVCIDIYPTHNLSKWTAFTYQTPAAGDVQELGIGGYKDNLRVWLAGAAYDVRCPLPLNAWHTVCLTWSLSSGILAVYLNSSRAHSSQPVARRLRAGGALVLGQYQLSHSDFDRSWAFLGELYYFRLWDRVRAGGELSATDCSRGNVISWTESDLNFSTNTLRQDSTLRCDLTTTPSSDRTTSLPTSTAKTSSSPTSSGRTTSSLISSGRTTSSPTSGRTISLLTSSDRTTSSPSSSDRTTSPPSSSDRTTSSPSSSDRTTSSASSSDRTTSSASSSDRTISSSTLSKTITISSPPTVNFFRVSMVSIVTERIGASESTDVQNLTTNWLKHIFNRDISLVDLRPLTLIQRGIGSWDRSGNSLMIPKATLMSDRYQCEFRLQTLLSNAESQVQREIEDRLKNGDYVGATVELAADPSTILVHHLEPGMCQRDSWTVSEGTYVWPPTLPLKTAQLRCIANPTGFSSRECKLSDVTDRAIWSDPNMSQCRTDFGSILELESLQITPENREEVAEHILQLTKDATSFSTHELNIVVSKTCEIVNTTMVNISLASDVVHIVNNLLVKTETFGNLSSRILQLMEDVGNKVKFPESEFNITTETVSLNLVNVTLVQFWNIAFGVLSYINGFIQQDVNLRGQILNSYVVSSSIVWTSVENLKDPVQVTLRHLNPKESGQLVTCVFWDFNLHRGAGGWNSSGCEVASSGRQFTSCSCDHLTHFGILLDISGQAIDPLNLWILTLITYVGCGVSSFFLGITLMTYLAFGNLRQDYPAKILMNLCTSLFLLNMAFLTNSWMSSFHLWGLCVSAAASLHYFLLTSCTWMCVEAVHMYFALVRVFNIYIRHYILKFCLIGWGLPAAVVVTLLSVDIDTYQQEENVTSVGPLVSFCWLRNGVAFYISVVTYCGLVFLVNLTMSLVVLQQIRVMRSNRRSNSSQLIHHLRATASLIVLLGLTWGLGFLSWGSAQLTFTYLFSILNTLQGFFIFLFHCLMKDNVRTQWRIHLCCGRLELDKCSEGSKPGPGAMLRAHRTGSWAQSNKSDSTTTSWSGSRKNLVLPQVYGTDPDYNSQCNEWSNQWNTWNDQRNQWSDECTDPCNTWRDRWHWTMGVDKPWEVEDEVGADPPLSPHWETAYCHIQVKREAQEGMM
ncbi:adhesion G-protein coupled receptor G4 isoform X2 [Narcine bancroftii]|uniref:adhesion G-protein coupled receptor G4 isoform X2 n=1 Tax=Narcine bancroftii TaxID=1343680 RepID=UPI003831C2CD